MKNVIILKSENCGACPEVSHRNDLLNNLLYRHIFIILCENELDIRLVDKFGSHLIITLNGDIEKDCIGFQFLSEDNSIKILINSLIKYASNFIKDSRKKIEIIITDTESPLVLALCDIASMTNGFVLKNRFGTFQKSIEYLNTNIKEN